VETDPVCLQYSTRNSCGLLSDFDEIFAVEYAAASARSEFSYRDLILVSVDSTGRLEDDDTDNFLNCVESKI
jgi:hypothetical protein